MPSSQESGPTLWTSTTMWVSKYFFRKRITHIKNKPKLNSIQIVKADKRSSVIKTFQNYYNDKIANFFSSNQFDTVCTTLRTPSKYLRNFLYSCKTQISNEQKTKLINLIPNPSNICGLIKIHKLEHPNRPTVNMWHAPVYKFSKFFTKWTCPVHLILRTLHFWFMISTQLIYIVM